MNQFWGKSIVDQLIQHGIDYFCIAPGFRTTPLVLAVAEDARAKSFVHFDERGLGFHALGYAKATGKPAVVIVTSGTAVGNLMPAVMEASASCVPMILLTCDRPSELRDTMANQTADQLKIFGAYVRYFFDLPTPSTSLPENFLGTTIAQALSRSHYPLKGPVQINCPFSEPFFDEHVVHTPSAFSTCYSFPELSCDAPKWAAECAQIEKGVIILGANGGSSSVKKLSQKLGWPILPDILSGYRHLAEESTIPYYHHILKSLPELKAEGILYFGDALVSKALMHWIKKHKRVIHVAEHSKRCDPLHCVTDRIVCTPEHFCEQVAVHLPQKENSWIEKWKNLSNSISFSIEGLTEPSIPGLLASDAALFFANSMPIRDADMFFFPKTPCGPVFANRGLSGIDGNIATCAGIAQVMPLTALIGDQTLLHDLNSLAQLKKTQHPVQLIVINNGGGGIFSFVAVNEKKDVLNPYFAASHQTQFEKAAQLFDLSYCKASTKAQLKAQLQKKESCFVEVLTNREENLQLHKKIDQEILDALCTSCSMAF